MWLLIAAAVAIYRSMPASAASAASGGTTPTATSGVWATLLFVSWVIDGAALFYVLSAVARNFSPASREARSLFTVAAVIVAIILGSVLLYRAGHTGLAIALAGGPPLLLGLVAGGMVLVILLLGRKVRWN
jgi:hypothetical protein